MSEDLLIVVDERDGAIRPLARAACHRGAGVLHRAFSIYLFDAQQRVLLQQRSAQKPLWPLHWSNSCCSHPRWGEAIDAAAERRLIEELGLHTPLRALFKFQYQAAFGPQGSERELCTVYVGAAEDVGTVNADEVAAWQFVAAQELDRRIAADSSAFTPWLLLAWARLRSEHWPEITALSQALPVR